MHYGLLKHRTGTIKLRSTGKVTLISSKKYKNNSFINKNKIKKYKILKRFSKTCKETEYISNSNPNIKKIKNFLSKK